MLEMIGLAKKDKDAVRRVRRELKLEAKYGNPNMVMICKFDPSVKPYYDRYKRYRQQECHSLYWAMFWMAFAALMIILAFFNLSNGYVAAVDMMLAMYWMNSSRIENARADMVRHEFFQYASDNAVDKAFNELFNHVKGGKDDEANTNSGTGEAR